MSLDVWGDLQQYQKNIEFLEKGEFFCLLSSQQDFFN